MPTEEQGPGTYPITIRVSDGASPVREDMKSFEITVAEVNVAPTLAAIADQTVDEGAALHFTALGRTQTFPRMFLATTSSWVLSPHDPRSFHRVFSWTPTETQGPRDYTLRLQVLDDAAVNPLPGLTDVRIHVNEVNQGPTLAAIADVTVHEGAPLYFAVSGSDTDLPANTLTYEIASGTAPGMSLDPLRGMLAGRRRKTRGLRPIRS